MWDYIRDRFLSVAMVMGVAFLFLVSLIVSAVLSFVSAYVFRLPENWLVLSHVLNFTVSLAVFTGIFAMLFKVLPDVIIAWRDVWLGALMTAILFTLGKSAIGMYIGQSTLASSYGVAGSLIVLLVWVYYSAQIMFLGAEFTQVYANQYGKKIIPTDNAVLISEQKPGKPVTA
jgi:membrane protein